MANLVVDVPKTTISIQLRGARRFRARLTVLTWLMTVAGWIGGAKWK
ncbi:hypothetical protein [Devosia sp. 2618]